MRGRKFRPFLQDILPKGRSGGRQLLVLAVNEIPFADRGQVPDIENAEALGLHLKLDGVSRDEGQAQSRHHGLLDRLVRADLDADCRLG